MKSKEEWCEELQIDLDHAKMFEAIQIDARKQGMLDAAEIASKHRLSSTGVYSDGVNNASNNIQYLILTAANNLTLKITKQ